MKGATADPWVKTINPPKISKKSIIGKSQYFFLTLKNSQNSFMKLILKLIFHFTFRVCFFDPVSLFRIKL